MDLREAKRRARDVELKRLVPCLWRHGALKLSNERAVALHLVRADTVGLRAGGEASNVSELS